MRWGRGTTTACVGGPGAGALASGALALVAVAVVLVLGLGLAGCAPEPIPPVPTTDRPSPTVEPTPEPEPEPAPETVHPQRPAAMDTVDAAGAEAAVEYFLSLYPYAYATGDLDQWRAMSHEECIFCASVIDNVEALVADRHHAVGGAVTFSGIESRTINPGAAWEVTLVVSQAASAHVDAEGTTVGEYGAGDIRSSVFVVHDGEQWWIRGIDNSADSPDA